MALTEFREWWYADAHAPSPAAIEAMKSAAANDASAKAWLALAVGSKLLDYPISGSDLLKEAADAGNPLARAVLGREYVRGAIEGGTPVDGLKLMQSACESGNADAAQWLGELYLTGYKDLVQIDYARAAQYFDLARERGFLAGRAKSALAHLHLGEAETARSLLEEGAQRGDLEAQAMLVRWLFTGTGVRRDTARATALARQWADKNDYVAGQLGAYYLESTDVEQISGEQILDLLNRGSRSGDTTAALMLADCLLYGVNECPPSPKLAIELYTKLAERGNAAASFHLGRLFLEGTVFDRDLGKASEYLRKSAASGHWQARGLLRQIDEERTPVLK